MNTLQKILIKMSGVKGISLPAVVTPKANPGQMVKVNDQLVWMADSANSYIVNGYQANDIIYSAVNLITEKIKIAPWNLYTVVDDEALKQYNAFLEQKEYVKAKKMRTKALKPLEKLDAKTQRLADLLKWANPRETFNDLIANSCAYRLITGNSFKYANTLPGGANKGLPMEIFNMPAQYMVLKVTSNFPQRVTGYKLSLEAKDYTAEEVQHIALFNPFYNINGAGMYGQSPIKAAIKTLSRNQSAKQAATQQFQNGGGSKIVYIDDAIVPASGREAQIKEVKKAWAKEYTGEEAFGKTAFSGYKMGAIDVGMAIKEMALTEVEAVDMRALANIWGIPSQLLNDPENKSYNNSKEAEKALTSRCALPYLTAERNSFNQKLQRDWGFAGVNVYVDFDMSVYAELQEDQKEKWGWVSQLVVPEVYKLELMGLDVPKELPKDLILVDSNKISLADLLSGATDDEASQANDELNKAGLLDYLRIAK